MLEDIVVVSSRLGSATALCTACGMPYPGRLLLPMEGYAGAGTRSAFAAVCPECDHLLRLGDDPAVPLTAEMEWALERSA